MSKKFYNSAPNSFSKPFYKTITAVSCVLNLFNLSSCANPLQDNELEIKASSKIGAIDSSGNDKSETTHKSIIGIGLKADWNKGKNWGE